MCVKALIKDRKVSLQVHGTFKEFFRIRVVEPFSEESQGNGDALIVDQLVVLSELLNNPPRFSLK